jgi:Transcriptional regulator
MEHRVRLRHLRHFLEIARTRSLTRAAEALHTVQPSLSRSLGELEAELGKTLFLRTPQGMLPTPAGLSFYQSIAGPLSIIDEGIARARGAPERQVVRVALTPAITRLLGVAAIQAFTEANPEVRVIIEARSYAEAVQRLHGGEVDFAVGRLLDPNALTGLSYEQLFAEPIIFTARAGHPLAGRTGLELDDIEAFLVVGPEDNAIIWNEIHRFLFKRGRPRFRQVLESSSYDFARSFLRDSDAIGCLSLSIVRPELERGELVRLDIDVEEMMGSVGVTYRSGAPLTPAARALFDQFRSQARRLYP